MQPHKRLLMLLDESPIIKEHRTVELKIVDQETFSFKVRARITDEFGSVHRAVFACLPMQQLIGHF